MNWKIGGSCSNCIQQVGGYIRVSSGSGELVYVGNSGVSVSQVNFLTVNGSGVVGILIIVLLLLIIVLQMASLLLCLQIIWPKNDGRGRVVRSQNNNHSPPDCSECLRGDDN